VKQEMLTSSGILIVLGNDEKEENDSHPQMPRVRLSIQIHFSNIVSTIGWNSIWFTSIDHGIVYLEIITIDLLHMCSSSSHCLLRWHRQWHY
jgi:hypothetical protein